MNSETIVLIVSFVLTAVILVWGLYEKVKGNVSASVAALIAEAELSGLLGKEKMALVVGWLYDHIPVVFKKILNREALEALAQKIFDYMKKYANAYIEAHNGTEDAYNKVNDELASEVAEKLGGLGPAGLKALAVSMNIDIEGKTDAEIIEAVVFMVMSKI